MLEGALSMSKAEIRPADQPSFPTLLPYFRVEILNWLVGVILPPRNLVSRNLEARNAAKHLTMYRTVFTAEKHPVPSCH